MHRDEAIRILAKHDLAELSSDARAELLDTTRYENWRADAGWSSLPVDLRAELEIGNALHAPDLPRYDDLLLLPIQHGYRGATNEFLSQRLAGRGQRPEQVEGTEPNMAACPCCGSVVFKVVVASAADHAACLSVSSLVLRARTQTRLGGLQFLVCRLPQRSGCRAFAAA